MFEKKIAVVTGGASGLGLEIAEQLLNEKAVVIIIDINDEKLDIVNKSFFKYKADVTSYSQIISVVDRIILKFEKIDNFVYRFLLVC